MDTYSLHKIYSGTEFPFNPTDYSKFKYGDKNVSRKFGFALAVGFIKEYLSINPIENQIVVISAPYDFIPTATFATKNYFIQKLNDYLVEKELPVIQEAKMTRTANSSVNFTKRQNYDKLSHEDRVSMIEKDSYHIDQKYLEGKTVLFIDDIKITGSHEKVIRQVLCSNVAFTDERRIFVYFAELANPKIDPSLENKLNHYFVNSLYQMDKVIKNEDWIPNTRAIKYILCNEHGALSEIFFQFQPMKVLQVIYHLAIGNSYHLVDIYKDNIDKIRKILITNKLL